MDLQAKNEVVGNCIDIIAGEPPAIIAMISVTTYMSYFPVRGKRTVLEAHCGPLPQEHGSNQQHTWTFSCAQANILNI